MSEKQMQRLFDRSVKGLAKQGRPAIEEHWCRYRTSDGLRCAVGQLIPDRRYHPFLEGRDAQNQAVLSAVGVEDPRIGMMLIDLQCAHDEADRDNWLPEFLAEAEYIATKLGLSTAAIAKARGEHA